MDVWDVYYAGLVAMTLHPGYQKEGTYCPTIKTCAETATEMLRIKFLHKYPGETECLGYQQP